MVLGGWITGILFQCRRPWPVAAVLHAMPRLATLSIIIIRVITRVTSAESLAMARRTAATRRCQASWCLTMCAGEHEASSSRVTMAVSESVKGTSQHDSQGAQWTAHEARLAQSHHSTWLIFVPMI